MQPDVQHDILAEIIAHRKVDLEKGGVTFGCTVPVERHRPVVPFLPQPGTILEIKRASPSKGMIVPDLDAVKTAQLYLQAGTTAISVLTEQNYFCGSLNDLVAVSDAAGTKAAVLRKDFLLDPDETSSSFTTPAPMDMRQSMDPLVAALRICSTPTMVTDGYSESVGGLRSSTPSQMMGATPNSATHQDVIAESANSEAWISSRIIAVFMECPRNRSISRCSHPVKTRTNIDSPLSMGQP